MNPTSGTAYEGLITALEGNGSKIKRLNQREVMAQCPAHEDRNPSLHVTDSNGKVLLYCHAGCAGKSILDALGLGDEALFDEKGKTREEVATTTTPMRTATSCSRWCASTRRTFGSGDRCREASGRGTSMA